MGDWTQEELDEMLKHIEFRAQKQPKHLWRKWRVMEGGRP